MTLELLVGIASAAIAIMQLFVFFWDRQGPGDTHLRKRAVILLVLAVSVLTGASVLVRELVQGRRVDRNEVEVLRILTSPMTYEDISAAVLPAVADDLDEAISNLVDSERISRNVASLRGPSGKYHAVRLFERRP